MSNLNRRLILLGIALLCLFGAFSILAGAGLPDRAPYSGMTIDGHVFAPEVSALAPPFSAEMISGTTLDLMRMRGSPTVINFWATWCVPCETELPELQAIQQEYGSRLNLVLINSGEARTAVQTWLSVHAPRLDSALDANSDIASLYRLRGQPTTFVIAPTGTIIAVFYGAVTRAQLEGALEPYL